MATLEHVKSGTSLPWMSRVNSARSWLLRLIRSESGSAAMVFVMSAPVWLGGLALGGEVGSWYYIRQDLQATADATATSLAGRVGTGASAVELTRLANQYLRNNRFDFSLGSVQVNFSSSGPIFNNGSTVGVTLTRTIRPYLTAMFNVAPFDVQAHAAAQVNQATVACVLGTSQTASATVTVNGTISVPGCEVVSNSNHNYSMAVGSGSLTTDCTRAAGYYQNPGSIAVSCKGGPWSAAGFALDPYVAVPDVDLSDASTCHYTNEVYTMDATHGPPIKVSTMSGGQKYTKFCNGAKLKMARPFAVSVYNVLYIFDNSQLEIVDGVNTTFNRGSFYFVNGGTLMANAPNSAVHLEPPTVGAFRGLLFFGARSNASANHQVIVGPGSFIAGAMYFPTSNVTFVANGQLGGCLQLIGRRVSLLGTWQGSGPCAVDGTLPIVASRNVRLIE